MFNAKLTIFVGSPETRSGYGENMTFPFIRFGEEAALVAADRAERSRDDGNVARFCHWRHIERVIATLSSDEVHGTVH
jgi:hypothetical protein